MKVIKTLVLWTLLIPAFANAALNLPEPDALLKRAAQDRSELLNVIIDLEFNIPEMRDPKVFDSYFAKMDALKELAVSSGLEEFYPQAVDKLALNMVANGMRWLDMTKESPQKIAYYLKWMNGDTLARFLGLVEYQISTNQDPVLLRRLSDNIELNMSLIVEKTLDLPYVQMGFKRLMSDAAVNLLKDESLSKSDLVFWISKIQMSSSFSEYLDYLNQQVYSIDEDNIRITHNFIYRFTLLSKQLSQMSEAAPNWLANSIGDSLVEITLRMIRFEEDFAAGEFESTLQLLGSRHLQGFSQQWMTQEKIPTQEYILQYLKASDLLVTRLQEKNMKKETTDFQKWMTRTAAPVMARKLDIEGQYQLKNSIGQIFYFTVALTKENSMVVALTNKNQSYYRTYFNVTYNLKKEAFVASQRDVDTAGTQNSPIEFTVTNGKMVVYDAFIRNEFQIMEGPRKQKFSNVWGKANKNAPMVDGAYEGTMALPTGTKMDVSLKITTFNGYSIGRIDSKLISVELNIGTDGDNGVLIMTSGNVDRGSWFQLRGNVTTDGFTGNVIIGGRGQGETFFLKKTR